ncbi:MAG: hypothetical protein IIT89_01090 [Aeriscardovia sp.]|nr:hypothetical protein [Aeriscardovia sp.]
MTSLRSLVRQRRTAALIGLAFAAVLELVVFNLPFWQTVGSSSVTVPDSAVAVGSGLRRSKQGFVVTKPDPSLDIRSPQILQYLRFNDAPSAPAYQTIWYSVGIYYGSNLTLHQGDSILPLSTGAPRSQYVNVGSYVSHVSISFPRASVGTVLPFVSVTLNPHVPFQLDTGRIGLMLFFVLMAVLLGPGSPLYHERLDTRSRPQLALLALMTTLLMGLYLFVWLMPDNAQEWVGQNYIPSIHAWGDQEQYARLADALIHHRLWLDLPVSPRLAALSDPYDYARRAALVATHPNVRVYLDHAFYHGRYYCYFGVVPAVLFFVPYQLMTGQWLGSAPVVLICALASAVFAALLVVRLAKAYFRDASLGMTMLAIWMLGLGSGVLANVFVAEFYAVPKTAAYLFTLIGLWCWLMALPGPDARRARPRRRGFGKSGKGMAEENGSKGKNISAGASDDAAAGLCSVSPWWIGAGSLFLAFDLGTRPQFEFAALLAVPIFWDSVFRDRALFSRKGWKPTLAALAPFILVFVPLFVYNAERFGGILDFGNGYQLTCDDPQIARFSKIGVLDGVFLYLFQPPTLATTFPFVGSGLTATPFWLFVDALPGSFFASLAPFAAVLFGAPWLLSARHKVRVSSRLRDAGHGLGASWRAFSSLVWTNVILGIVVLLVDCRLGGAAQTYLGDFAIFLVLAAVLVVLALCPAGVVEKQDRAGFLAKLAVDVLPVLVMAAILLQFFWTFSCTRGGDVISADPANYFAVQNWFLFLQ